MRVVNRLWAVCLAATALATACGSDDNNVNTANQEGGAATGGSSGSGTGGSATGGIGTGGSSTGGSSTGGNSTGGSATGGSSSGGAVGTGGSAGAITDGSVDAGNACDQLDACCNSTSLALRTQCQTIASQGMLTQCSTMLQLFCNGGSLLEAGAGGAGGGGCAALQQCCAALTGIQKTQCETLASTGNDMNCDTVASVFCP